MDSQTPPPEPAPARAEGPLLVIKFAGEGAADCSIEPIGRVTIGMVFAAAHLLDEYARQVYAQGTQANARAALVVPQPGSILPFRRG